MLNKESFGPSDLVSAEKLRYAAKVGMTGLLGYSGLRALYEMGRAIKDEYFTLPELPDKIVVEKKRLEPPAAVVPLKKQSEDNWFIDPIYAGAAGGTGVLAGIGLMNFLEAADDQVDFANNLADLDRLYTEKVRKKLQKKIAPADQVKIASCYIDGMREGLQTMARERPDLIKKADPTAQVAPGENDAVEGSSIFSMWPLVVGLGMPLGFYGGYLAAQQNWPMMSAEDALKDQAENMVGPELDFVTPKKTRPVEIDKVAMTKEAASTWDEIWGMMFPTMGTGFSLDPNAKLALAGLTTLGLANILYKGNKMLRYNLSDKKKYGALPDGVLNFSDDAYEEKLKNAK